MADATGPVLQRSWSEIFHLLFPLTHTHLIRLYDLFDPDGEADIDDIDFESWDNGLSLKIDCKRTVILSIEKLKQMLY
jgi:hypothetical protein